MEALPRPNQQTPKPPESPKEDKPSAPPSPSARPSLPSPPPLPPTSPSPTPQVPGPPPPVGEKPSPPKEEEKKEKAPPGPPPPPAPPPSAPPPAKPPAAASFSQAEGTPGRGPARVKRFIVLLSVVFIVVLIGFLGFTILRRTVLPSRQDITLTYWGLWEEADIIEPLLNDFVSAYTKDHPNISLTINYENRTVATLEQYKETLWTRLRRGTAPDIFRIHNSWVKEFANELAPLPENLMSETDYSSAFYPVAGTSAKVGEKIYAIPLEYDGLVLFYNKTLFKGIEVTSELSTWYGFRQQAMRLTQWEGNDPAKKIIQAGAAIGAADNISHSADILSLLFEQSGVNPLTDLETQAAAVVLDYYVGFVKEDHVWDETLPFSINAFANGQVAMIFGPSWRALDIHRLNPQLEFAAVPAPQLPEEEKKVHWATFWMEAVDADSEYTDVTWELLKFLSEEEQQQKFFSAASNDRLFGEPYSLVSLAESMATHDILGPLLTSAPNAVSGKMTDFSGNKDYVDAFKQAIADVLDGKKTDKTLSTTQATINDLEGTTSD